MRKRTALRFPAAEGSKEMDTSGVIQMITYCSFDLKVVASSLKTILELNLIYRCMYACFYINLHNDANCTLLSFNMPE